MSFSEVNYLGVVIVGIVLFVMGALWWQQKTLFPIWWKLMGHEGKSLSNPVDSMGKVFGLTALSCFVQAYFLSALIHGLNIESVVNAFITGFAIGFGISAVPTLSNRLFANAAFNKNGIKIWAIEGFPNAINFAVASAILVII